MLERPRVDERDVAALAGLHVACLDDSLVGAFGVRYVRSFYRYVARSPGELLVIRRDEAGGVVGAAVVSLSPSTLGRRLLVRTPLLLGALVHLVGLTAMLRASARRPQGKPSAEVEHPGSVPEIILMFTAPAARGQGHGGAMIREIDRRLRAMDVRVYQVKTISDPSNAALAFYRRTGFTPCGIAFRLGTCFQVFSRAVPPPGAEASSHPQ